MPELAEIKDSVWEEIDEVAAAKDMTVSGLINKILREWLEKNRDAVLDSNGQDEGEPGPEPEEEQ